jgi:hypothetical protein
VGCCARYLPIWKTRLRICAIIVWHDSRKRKWPRSRNATVSGYRCGSIGVKVWGLHATKITCMTTGQLACTLPDVKYAICVTLAQPKKDPKIVVPTRTFAMLSPATYLVFLGIFLAIWAIRRRRRRAKLPPGPPRLPIIGNLHQAPKESMWLPFQKWVDQYGPLVSLDFGGNILIIVGDYETARNLLDKRANVYSSRPRMVSCQ